MRDFRALVPVEPGSVADRFLESRATSQSATTLEPVAVAREGKFREDLYFRLNEPGSAVTTDGWVGYHRLAALGYHHEAVAIAGDQEVTDNSLPMIHLVFSNLKTWLLGTHHGASPRHLQAYLNEYVFRFNRRF